MRIQSSLLAAHESQPQPDVAVVPPGSYHEAHPSRALLLVEVAASYTRVTPYRAGERVRLRELPDVELGVDDILPP